MTSNYWNNESKVNNETLGDNDNTLWDEMEDDQLANIILEAAHNPIAPLVVAVL